MSGREIENLLSVIDESILSGRASVRGEILSYLLSNETTVLESLRSSDKVTVPTSSGPFEINLTELQDLVA